MTTEKIYLGHDNTISMVLTEEGEAQSLTAVTKMTLTVGAVTVSSLNGTSDPIKWSGTGFQTGEVRFTLGAQSLVVGVYDAPLVVYDEGHPEGTVWCKIPVEVIAEVERT